MKKTITAVAIRQEDETPEERRRRERQETLDVLWYRKWWIDDPATLLDDGEKPEVQEEKL